MRCAVFQLSFAIAAAGCGERAPVQRPFSPGVHVVDDAVKVGRDGRVFSHRQLGGYAAANPAWDGDRITLAGARGETVAFQLLFVAGRESIPAADLVVEPIASASATLDARSVRVFREHYTEVDTPSVSPAASTGPGAYPDALVPAELPEHGLPVDVPSRAVQGVWIDVHIPRDAPPGRYGGAVLATSAGAPLARLPIELRVYDFALPSVPHLVWRVGYGGFGEYLEHDQAIGYDRVTGRESQAFRDRERQLVELVWSYGLVPTTHYSSPVPEHAGTGDDLRLTWDGYDRRMAGYLDGTAFASGQPLPAVALPVNLQSYGGWPTGTHGTAAELDQATLVAALRQTLEHWRDRGWPLERSFVYLADEPELPRYAAIDAACRAIRDVSPDLPVAMALYTELAGGADALQRRFAGCVTHWALAGDYAELPRWRARQAAGDRLEVYQGSEPFLGSEALDADGLSLITWPWIAWRYRLDGLFLYNIVEWNYLRLDQHDKPWGGRPRDIWINPMNQSWVTNSHGVLVYPGERVGQRTVLPSIRLAQARRGLQDYEYLWLAHRAGAPVFADLAAMSVVPAALWQGASGLGGDHFGRAHWERDPRRWARTRQQLAAVIEALAAP